MPSTKEPTSVPQRLPTPPKTTTWKLSMCEPWPRLGLTLSIWESATPAIPAMPEPSPNVSASTRLVRMPIDAAIGRFCVTARISSPKRVKRSNARSAMNTAIAKQIIKRRLWGRVIPPTGKAHRLLEDQRESPGGQQGLERSAVKEADDGAFDDDADAAPHHKRQRHGDHQGVVEQCRIVVADDFLHDKGNVGADHHHLAMRHVDDAHDAEGNGEADGGEQQHRAERKTVPGVLHRLPQCQAILDGTDCRRGAFHHWGRGGRGQTCEEPERVLVGALANNIDRGELFLVAAFVA